MKRKLALLLATVMALSISVMPTSVFAASDNRITQTYPSLNDNTLLVGRDFGGFTGSYNATATTVSWWDQGDVVGDARVGTELSVEFKQRVVSGTYFRLELDNAEWFFKAGDGAQEDNIAGLDFDGISGLIDSMGFGAPSDFDVVDVRGTHNLSGGIGGVATFATEAGLWIAPDTANIEGDGLTNNTLVSGSSYVGYFLGMTGNNLTYIMGIQRDRRIADVVLTSDDAASSSTIQIPLPILTGDDETPVTLTVDGQTSGGDVSNSKLTIVGAVAGATTARIDDIASGRSSVFLKDVIVTETRLGTIHDGTFYIDAPTGYKFVNGEDSVTISALSIDTVPRYTYGVGTGFDITYANANARRMVVNLNVGGAVSQRVFGRLVISGLEVEPISSNTWGDITGLALRDASRGGTGITDVTFGLVGRRIDYGVTLTAADAKEGVPELYSGVLIEEGQLFTTLSDDPSIKLMEIRITENTPHSWWTGRNTKLTLPEGVMVRGVEITDSDNTEFADGDRVEMNAAGNMVRSGTTAAGYLSFEKNVITLGDIRSNHTEKEDEKIWVDMDIYVSVSNDMAGKDVEIALSGGGMDEDTTPDPLVVASIVAPITVETKTTTVGIGRLSQPTADIVITENYAGALREDGEIRTLIADQFGNAAIDTLDFVSATAEVTDGDLAIDFAGWANGRATGINATRAGELVLTIDAESTEPSTITLSDVKVSAATTLPWVDNVSYQILVYGTAVAENYNSARDAWKLGYFGDIKKDAGIFADYIFTTTTANPSGFDPTDELVLALEPVDGTIFCTVNGDARNIPTDSFPFHEGNTVYLPLRAVSEAFGLQVDWDSEQSIAKVTVSNNPYKAIEFMPNHQWYYINKVSSEMKYAETGEVVSPIIRNDRIFIPLRFLGVALGVNNDRITYVPEPAEGDPVSVPAVYFNKR